MLSINNGFNSSVLARIQGYRQGVESAVSTARSLDNSAADKFQNANEINVDNVSIPGFGKFDNLEAFTQPGKQGGEVFAFTRNETNGASTEVEIRLSKNGGDRDDMYVREKIISKCDDGRLQVDTLSLDVLSDGRVTFKDHGKDGRFHLQEGFGGALVMLEDPPVPV